MRAFAFVLLCVLVAVQGRNTGLQASTKAAAALGENPWVVHLRLAVSTSGFLNTCVGSLIDNSWILTTASCLNDATFIWARYGTVNVLQPSLVTENGGSAVRVHPDYDSETGANNVALLSINRVVHSTDNISPLALAGDADTDSATFCAYGATEDNLPGVELSCAEVAVTVGEDGIVVSSDEVETTEFDVGAPLVSNGVQIGFLTAPASEDSLGSFADVAEFLDWIESETGIDFTPEAENALQ